MENITLSLYKSLLNFEKISTLEFMRKNPEFLDIPGYEISNILNDGVKNGYIERFEDNNKTYYSATNKCQEVLEQIKKNAIEKANKEEIERKLKKKKSRNKIATKTAKIFISVVIIAIVILLVVRGASFGIAKIQRKNAVEKYGEEQVAEFESLKPGDNIVVGKYEQDGNKSNGAEDIEWIVLDNKGGKVLVISKYILCEKSFVYSTKYYQKRWEDTEMREWLNGEFYNSVFNAEEKEKIKLSNVKAKTKYPCEIDNGNDTEDYVFLLNIDEVLEYFPTEESRKALATKEYTMHAYKHDEHYKEHGNYYEWWLRSHTESSGSKTVVLENGEIDYFGYSTYADSGVRPAMWLSLFN